MKGADRCAFFMRRSRARKFAAKAARALRGGQWKINLPCSIAQARAEEIKVVNLKIQVVNLKNRKS